MKEAYTLQFTCADFHWHNHQESYNNGMTGAVPLGPFVKAFRDPIRQK